MFVTRNSQQTSIGLNALASTQSCTTVYEKLMLILPVVANFVCNDGAKIGEH